MSASDDKFPPPGVGESMGRRGEDIAKAEKEPGRVESGVDDAGRPVSKSTQRLQTGVDPQEPVDPDSPNLPSG